MFIILGLRVTEVAHDMQTQVAKYIKEDLKVTNFYDTWHGKSSIIHVCLYVFII